MVDPLRGSCTCGRNNYAIIFPSPTTVQQHFEIFFDDHTDHAYLRVPLSSYQSFTTAFYPDETHNNIRRIFVPLHAPHSQQIFCGLCGTHLSFWSEQPPEESQYLSVAVSTMKGHDLERLEDLGVLRPEVEDAADPDRDNTPTMSGSRSSGKPTNGSAGSTGAVVPNQSSDSTITQGTSGSLSWIQAARSSGGLRTRTGFGRSQDGKTLVEWEVSEYDEAEGVGSGAKGKRKIDDVGQGEDRDMTE